MYIKDIHVYLILDISLHVYQRYMAKVSRNVPTLTLQMFSINILCLMSNFSSKGNYSNSIRGDSKLIHTPRIALWGNTVSRDTSNKGLRV